MIGVSSHARPDLVQYHDHAGIKEAILGGRCAVFYFRRVSSCSAIREVCSLARKDKWCLLWLR